MLILFARRGVFWSVGGFVIQVINNASPKLDFAKLHLAKVRLAKLCLAMPMAKKMTSQKRTQTNVEKYYTYRSVWTQPLKYWRRMNNFSFCLRLLAEKSNF